MSLIRSLNSGVSGLKAFQTKMDTIGNNIANVDTAGFKSSRVSFAEMMNERLGRTDGAGESSPQLSNQVGLGVRVASIDRDFSQGAMQSTGRGTDLAIQGDGYFMVNDGQQSLMTRAGNFAFNKDGYLVDQGGRFVQGYNANSTGNILSGGTTENIKIDFENALQPKATENVTLAGNLDAESNETQTMSTTVYDSQGRAHSLQLDFSKTANPNEWSYTASFMDGETISGGDTGTINFDTDGKLTTASINDIVYDPGNGLDPNTTFSINLGDAANGTTMTQYSGTNTAKVLSQDGYTKGEMVDINIDGDGQVHGVYDNGQSKVLSQLALGQVQNENGLDMVGGGLYRATSAAGETFIDTADNLSETSVNAGSLEGSNVDLAKEFTDMITSQRAYQSNARVISTSDEMLMEAVNLKR